jgi:4a-hydroxytetrahydrobiopterin dehydratase
MLLSREQVNKRLKEINKWKLEGDEISLSSEFKDFKQSMDFVNKIADEAEKMDHHPDINISYNKVKLNLMTHSEGGLTDKDFNLAEKIIRLL